MIGDTLDLDNAGLSAQSPLFVRPNYFIREYFAIVKAWLVY